MNLNPLRAGYLYRIARYAWFVMPAFASSLIGSPDPARYEGSVGARFGYDSNPYATGGMAATLLGQPGSAVLAANSVASITQGRTRLSYAAEAVSFVDLPDESFRTHRISGAHRHHGGRWTGSLDVSSFYIDGSDTSFTQSGSASGNAVALMRDRRRQWQHRGRAQLLATWEGGYALTTLNVLDIDYRTAAEAGKWVFTDRQDAMVGLDVGRKLSNTWYAGVRAGRQRQATSPLPGAAFDASNRYHRFVVGWELTPRNGKSLSLAAGPDFRTFQGNFDHRMRSNPRLTSLWCEGSGSIALRPGVSLAGKVSRWVFLSSVGKSAYIDTVGEAGIVWRIRPFLSVRTACRAQRTEYVLAIRDDWQTHLTNEVSLQLTKRTVLALEVVDNRGWDGLSGSNDRAFQRGTGNLALTHQF